MCLDKLKGSSDDFYYTEEHMLFLLSKYRTFLLKQRYADIKKIIPKNNYQEICFDVSEITNRCGISYEPGTYLKSNSKIPAIMDIGIPKVYPCDYFVGDIAYISRDRMPYVGYNKYLANMLYASIAGDNYMYFKIFGNNYQGLTSIKFNAIFQDIIGAFDLPCLEVGNTKIEDTLDNIFPLEDALIAPLIELVIKEFTRETYKPEDIINNSKDDLGGIK